jgi:hypothetical protein
MKERIFVNRPISAILFLLASFSLTSALHAAAVPFSYTAQDRSVSATSSATGYPATASNPGPITDSDGETQTANGYAQFSGNAAAQSNIGAGNAFADGSASQQSSLTSTGFSASGSVTADTVFGIGGPANSTAGSIFNITFDVSQAESYVFSANLFATTDPGEADATMASIALTHAKTGKNVITPISAVNLSNFSTTGTLKAGLYDYTLDIQAASNDANLDSINYDISLIDGPVQSAGGIAPTAGGGGSAVPLPSSGLTALAMLSALALAGLARRYVRPTAL